MKNTGYTRDLVAWECRAQNQTVLIMYKLVFAENDRNNVVQILILNKSNNHVFMDSSDKNSFNQKFGKTPIGTIMPLC